MKLYVDVINTRTGEIEAQGSVNVKDIKDKSHKFSKISLNKAFKPKQNVLYEFRYYTKSNDTVYFTLEEDTTPLATYYRTRQKDYSSSYCEYGGEKEKKVQTIMQLVGRAK